jgi:hypothetical protein
VTFVGPPPFMATQVRGPFAGSTRVGKPPRLWWVACEMIVPPGEPQWIRRVLCKHQHRSADAAIKCCERILKAEKGDLTK